MKKSSNKEFIKKAKNKFGRRYIYSKVRYKGAEIKVKIIAYDKKITNIPLAEIRYLPKKYESPVAMNIYGNKTAIILWAEKPIVIAIREKEIADSYRNHFELMWKLAKP